MGDTQDVQAGEETVFDSVADSANDQGSTPIPEGAEHDEPVDTDIHADSQQQEEQVPTASKEQNGGFQTGGDNSGDSGDTDNAEGLLPQGDASEHPISQNPENVDDRRTEHQSLAQEEDANLERSSSALHEGTEMDGDEGRDATEGFPPGDSVGDASGSGVNQESRDEEKYSPKDTATDAAQENAPDSADAEEERRNDVPRQEEPNLDQGLQQEGEEVPHSHTLNEAALSIDSPKVPKEVVDGGTPETELDTEDGTLGERDADHHESQEEMGDGPVHPGQSTIGPEGYEGEPATLLEIGHAADLDAGSNLMGGIDGNKNNHGATYESMERNEGSEGHERQEKDDDNIIQPESHEESTRSIQNDEIETPLESGEAKDEPHRRESDDGSIGLRGLKRSIERNLVEVNGIIRAVVDGKQAIGIAGFPNAHMDGVNTTAYPQIDVSTENDLACDIEVQKTAAIESPAAEETITEGAGQLGNGTECEDMALNAEAIDSQTPTTNEKDQIVNREGHDSNVNFRQDVVPEVQIHDDIRHNQHPDPLIISSMEGNDTNLPNRHKGPDVANALLEEPSVGQPNSGHELNANAQVHRSPLRTEENYNHTTDKATVPFGDGETHLSDRGVPHGNNWDTVGTGNAPHFQFHTSKMRIGEFQPANTDYSPLYPDTASGFDAPHFSNIEAVGQRQNESGGPSVFANPGQAGHHDQHSITANGFRMSKGSIDNLHAPMERGWESSTNMSGVGYDRPPPGLLPAQDDSSQNHRGSGETYPPPSHPINPYSPVAHRTSVLPTHALTNGVYRAQIDVGGEAPPPLLCEESVHVEDNASRQRRRWEIPQTGPQISSGLPGWHTRKDHFSPLQRSRPMQPYANGSLGAGDLRYSHSVHPCVGTSGEGEWPVCRPGMRPEAVLSRPGTATSPPQGSPTGMEPRFLHAVESNMEYPGPRSSGYPPHSDLRGLPNQQLMPSGTPVPARPTSGFPTRHGYSETHRRPLSSPAYKTSAIGAEESNENALSIISQEDKDSSKGKTAYPGRETYKMSSELARISQDIMVAAGSGAEAVKDRLRGAVNRESEVRMEAEMAVADVEGLKLQKQLAEAALEQMTRARSDLEEQLQRAHAEIDRLRVENAWTIVEELKRENGSLLQNIASLHREMDTLRHFSEQEANRRESAERTIKEERKQWMAHIAKLSTSQPKGQENQEWTALRDSGLRETVAELRAALDQANKNTQDMLKAAQTYTQFPHTPFASNEFAPAPPQSPRPPISWQHYVRRQSSTRPREIYEPNPQDAGNFHARRSVGDLANGGESGRRGWRPENVEEPQHFRNTTAHGHNDSRPWSPSRRMQGVLSDLDTTAYQMNVKRRNSGSGARNSARHPGQESGRPQPDSYPPASSQIPPQSPIRSCAPKNDSVGGVQDRNITREGGEAAAGGACMKRIRPNFEYVPPTPPTRVSPNDLMRTRADYEQDLKRSRQRWREIEDQR